MLPVTPRTCKADDPDRTGSNRVGCPVLCLLSYVRVRDRTRHVPGTVPRSCRKEPPAGIEPTPRPYKGRVLAVDTTEASMETVGVEPTFPRCKRGALPPSFVPRVRTVDSNHYARGTRVTAASSPVLASARKRAVGRIRTGTSRITTSGACRYTTTTMRRCRLRRRRLTTAGFETDFDRREIIMARAAGRISRRRAGTTGLEPARGRLTSECSCR